MTILTFFLILFILVLVHEFGHFIVAKKSGMRVDEFGIGFPPKLFGIKKGETEYTFNLFPIGGFVKIYGEDLDHEEGYDDQRAFSKKSKTAQALVLIAGIAMNVLFAWLLFAVALSVGVQTAVEESTASDEAQLVVTSVLSDSPAHKAGLTQGMVITEVSTEEKKLISPSPTSFSEFTEGSNGEVLEVLYTEDGEVRSLSILPEQGVSVSEPDRYAVGIGLTFVDVISRPVHVAIGEAFMLTGRAIRDVTYGISGLLKDALTFKADLSQVAGPVGIVGLVGEASAFGFSSLLLFTAFISLNLAVINLLPFPALDGGRLLFVFIEAIKGSPLNPRYVQVLNTLGFLLLLLLMAAVTWNDIARIL